MSKKKSHTIIDTNYAVLQTQRFPIMAVGGGQEKKGGYKRSSFLRRSQGFFPLIQVGGDGVSGALTFASFFSVSASRQ